MSAGRPWGGDAIRRMGALVRAMWTRAVGDAATLARLRRGQEIADRRGRVKRLAHNRYEVRSQSRESTTYEVRFGGKGASCECPDHQYRKTVCKHIAAVMQRNSGMRKAGGNVPGADPAPDPDAAQAEPVLAGEPGGDEPAAGTGTIRGKADGGKADGDMDITKGEAVARLTTIFPQMGIAGMLDMPPREAMLAISEAFDHLSPQEATTEVRMHVQALLLALMDDVVSECPGMVIELVPADTAPPACPRCGSDYIRYGSRNNQKGVEQTYLCKGPEGHRFTFNPGFERRRYPNGVIARAVRLYPKIRSAREVADELEKGGKGPHHVTVSRWVHDMVWMVVKCLKKIGMRGIGHACSTDEVVEDVMGRGSCVATISDHDTRFCLAVRVSPTKDGQNSADLFRDAKRMTGRDPMITRSDSLEAIGSGHGEVFGHNPCAILVRDAHIRNQRRTNNRHERFNSTLRGMFGGRRGRLSETCIMAAWLHYNYLRPHMALGEITPAEKAGVIISGPDKTTTLIQNAAMSGTALPQPQWNESGRADCMAA